MVSYKKGMNFPLHLVVSAAQQDLSCDESGVRGAEEKLFSGLLDGTGEYALVYEDDEGDRMLVGDIPWRFVLLIENNQ